MFCKTVSARLRVAKPRNRKTFGEFGETQGPILILILLPVGGRRSRFLQESARGYNSTHGLADRRNIQRSARAVNSRARPCRCPHRKRDPSASGLRRRRKACPHSCRSKTGG